MRWSQHTEILSRRPVGKKLSCFGSLDLFTRETRHLRSVAFVLRHAKHTERTSFNSLIPPAGKAEFMPPHLSGVVSFYSSSGYGFKVCVSAVIAPDIAASPVE